MTEGKSKKLSIGLINSDYKHLEKFKRDINYTGKVRLHGRACMIVITSRKIYEDLTNLGVTERKSSTLLFPEKETIPKYLFHHFLRGCFDGDGTIQFQEKEGTYRIGFSGTKSMCQGFLESVEKSNNITLQFKDGIKNYAEFYIKGNRKTKRIMDYLYKDATVYLDRKYKIYEELCNYVTLQKERRVQRKLQWKKTQRELEDLSIYGFKGYELAEIYNCSESQISNYLKDLKNQKYQEDKKMVNDLYRKQKIKNKSKIHRITGFSRDYIRKLLK